MSADATDKNDCVAPESERTITLLCQHLLILDGRPKRAFGLATWIPLISLRMPKHSVESRMLYLNDVID